MVRLGAERRNRPFGYCPFGGGGRSPNDGWARQPPLARLGDRSKVRHSQPFHRAAATGACARPEERGI